LSPGFRDFARLLALVSGWPQGLSGERIIQRL
jgi:hypothetical protein